MDEVYGKRSVDAHGKPIIEIRIRKNDGTDDRCLTFVRVGSGKDSHYTAENIARKDVAEIAWRLQCAYKVTLEGEFAKSVWDDHD